MSNKLPITAYTPSDATRKVVLTYLDQQPWYVQKKDLITMIAGGVVTLAQLNLVPASAPEWVHIVLGALTWIAALFIISGTPGAVTPSMEHRLAQTAAQLEQDERIDTMVKEMDRVYVPPVAQQPVADDYEAKEAARVAAEDAARFSEVEAAEYQGEHRAEP